MAIEYNVVDFTTNHTKLMHYNAESTKPSTWRLLKTIKRPMKPTYYGR